MRALIFILASIAVFAYAQSGVDLTYGEHGYDNNGRCLTCDTPSSQTSRKEQPKTPVSSTSVATPQRILKVLQLLPPGETKRGLLDYYSVLGYNEYPDPRSVGTQNVGLAKHFEGPFVKSDAASVCVRDAAIGFYEEIAKVIRGNSLVKCEPATTPDYGCEEDRQRPQLNHRAGEGPHKRFSPGWVWQVALRHAKGDPNTAMFFIGMCGHDDIGQGKYEYIDSSEKALDDIQQDRAQHLKRRAILESQLVELKKNPDTNRDAIYRLTPLISYEISKLQSLEGKTSLPRNMECPHQEAAFYVSGSLHASADIPEALKIKVQKTQAEVDGVEGTPGKYYHVYGAAFMACQLIQSGYSPTKASFVQQQAARFYRGTRMCEVANVEYEYQAPSLKELAPYMLRYGVKNTDSLVIAAIRQIQKGELKCSEDVWSEENPLCRLVVDVGYLPEMLTYVDASTLTNADVTEKMREWRRDSDAAALYRSWYMGGKVGPVSLPCTDIRVMGPEDLMNPSGNFFGNLAKPLGWSDERYQDASRKLATWDADFEWTIAQHKAGADYAGKVCKKRAADEPPFTQLCPVEGTSKPAGAGSTTPKGGSAPQGVR